MAHSPNSYIALVLVFLLIGTSSAQLSENFYSKKCPKVFKTVQSVVKTAVAKENRIGASLLRLHFHDCFVDGCDGSILLDDTSSFKGEKTAGPNNNSVRGYEVIDAIKSKVEAICPGVVSCADIVAITARDSVVILGGPFWKVKVGRRDSKTANFTAANTGVIPAPTSNLTTLISTFKAQGLSVKDMVALSGAHTIGRARCTSFRGHIYNDSNIDSTFAKIRQKNCPRTTGSGDNNLANLDLRTPTHFDNNYYKNLIIKRGLLHSDQVLFNGGTTDSLVKTYSQNGKVFDSDFVAAMIKMGDNKPLTGKQGEIRKNCRRLN
ncbi:putative peroxidase [Medicago truncatula]|uniref:Peroxidase n=1 Tax=Medicago truncatula TaxID=3880 RepID=A0A072UXA0_MEDTR|nr:peroxidase 4 [Medicago truncatula]KEH34419.1 anionic peroxidase swpb3 protein [Medicago truncatula]RHN67824.1 putative peroxidase [Medicago truncatula]